ncbi:MAG: sodium/proline symporter PutP [Oscillospiraceae bacterium]|nr:sodium/proline symporter PutP [Oscillospiraceae bacterium]
MLGIGFYFTNKSKSMGDYFLAGRSLGSWVTAMSAQASDMSGWLLMGLPGAAYATGMGNYWLAVGLCIGTVLNWCFVAKRLRTFTEKAGDSITIPEYFQNRFKTDSPVVRLVCAVVIFVFFLVYTTSAFVSGGKLFMVVFGAPETAANEKFAVIFTALIIVLYTLFGGFNAVAWTDFIQGLLMIIAIVALPIAIINNTSEASLETLKSMNDGAFLSFTQDKGFNSIISDLAWALGYFGMPHILVRFMAIKDKKLVKKSAIIAIVWVIISLFAAVLIGILGRAYLDSKGIILDGSAQQELIFIKTVKMLFPAAFAGIFLSAVLASIMSTADSQLLVTASAVVNDIFKIFKKNISDKTAMWISRGAVMAISVIACILALNPKDSIMGIVSNAWAGFGASFGPAILFSIYWKRVTLKGTVAGIISGATTVILWCYVLKWNGDLYAIIPGFIISAIVTVIGSLIDKKPSDEVIAIFDEAVKD